MPRWILAILTAVMLVLALAPASGQVQAPMSGQQAHCDSLELQGQDAPSGVLAEHLPMDGPLEIPELFDAPRPLRSDERAAMAPPSLNAAVMPPPYLKGPQRPPRAAALHA
ncbi:hypothetical protein [Paucibacter sp. M5-1]|uniref:hypothetical protein n=1 Tax=Paucibacter sp. M5-1 TaxID=3015998 RepID=UPI0022B8C5E9|nr:hypothetical protein [Paucibacter sp. M5-1]MCZ7884443.1 hypothetical protein [Paucibacter sp. M5-1]